MAEFRDSVEIEAPPQVVLDHLTTNEGMTAWMGQYADLDPVPGGRFAVDIAGYPVRGEYLVVEPFRRVMVSWGLVGSEELPAGASRVEFLLTPIAGGTRVDLHHVDLPEPEVRGHEYGWARFMPRLAIAGAGGDAGPLAAPDRLIADGRRSRGSNDTRAAQPCATGPRPCG